MYFIDDNLTVSNPIPDSSFTRNTGLKRRHGICTAKPTFDMIGPLHVDVFNQSKYTQVAKDVWPQVGITWDLHWVPIGQNDWGPAICVPISTSCQVGLAKDGFQSGPT